MLLGRVVNAAVVHGSIFNSMMANDEGAIFNSTGSHPSSPRPCRPPQWASDGQEPSPHHSMRLNCSLITEREMLTSSTAELIKKELFGIRRER